MKEEKEEKENMNKVKKSYLKANCFKLLIS